MASSSVQHSQPQPLPSTPQYTSPPITIVLTIILLVFFFVCFFSIYFCRCFMQNILYTWHLRHSPTESPVAGATTPANIPRGLDVSIVQSYPTFTYSSVKGYRREKYGLECAICLVEFQDSDVLRLLTPCCHVFHQECIDLWLESHKTCPVCRRKLDSPIDSPIKSSWYGNNNGAHDEDTMTELHEPMDGSFSITIKDDQDQETRVSPLEGEKVASGTTTHPQNGTVQNFSRSHSTGHSIVRNSEEENDRFTLKLPEHVKSNIIRGHCSSKSWPTSIEYKSKSRIENCGVVEVSRLSGEDTNKI